MPGITRIWRPGRQRNRAARVAGVSFRTVAAGAVSRPEPSAAATAGELHGVWCTSTSGCVPAGDHFSQDGGLGEALAERWNGSAWPVTP